MEKQIYDFKGNTLDVYLNEKGDPIFIGKQVTDILEYRSAHDGIKYLDEDEKLIRQLIVSGQNRDVIMVTESGLYSLILRSRKPEAKVFKKWVTSEVLPSIRKHGAYMTNQTIEQVLTDPDTIIKLAQNMKEERALRLQAEKDKQIAEEAANLAYTKIVEDRPKILFAETLHDTGKTMDIGTLSVFLNQHGYVIGRNRLYAYLRDNGYLIKSGPRRHQPTIKYVSSGLFDLVTKVYKDKVNYQTMVTPLGQEYIINLIRKDEPLLEEIGYYNK